MCSETWKFGIESVEDYSWMYDLWDFGVAGLGVG